ncbi:helix-turn-helix domain-containing protein [Methylobacterium sp. J-030]|uniref:helix-turn-helix domain-containing protein n=1 Tax=Methylobacterium sp. J-030 TaxID=2836627 RepID=UPI001FB939A3|nr:helix-turn-helix domain-containing protein [Methylobacterium sp. J-030]MCJ2069650.1 helix-turn-helix domain-containing protein [Methylobacterium sp. J-030]
MASADLQRLDFERPFSASRMIAQSKHGGVFHTVSRPYSVDRTPRHVRRDGRDDVGILVALKGRGYLEQGQNGTLIRVGDIGFQTWGRPGGGGGLTDFEEIRLTLPRATFQSQIGDVSAFVGSRIPAGPLNELFFAYSRILAASVHTMSEAETGIAIESALHLLRGIVHGHTRHPEEKISANALRSLALARIQRCLHDPEFRATTLAADLRVSRSRLYAAFAAGEGIAAAIRDARLDRAYDRILRTRTAGCKVGSIMAGCGFTDPSVFSRAFRQRFGLSPRDLIALRDG